MASIKEVNEVLAEHDISVGVSNDKHACGSMEWFEKSTGEFANGFATADEAYSAAAQYIRETTGIDMPTLNDDGEFELPSGHPS